MSQGVPLHRNEILGLAGRASAVLKDSMIYHEFNMAIGVGESSDESCPRCGATLLANKRGDKWCSASACSYEHDISNTSPDAQNGIV